MAKEEGSHFIPFIEDGQRVAGLSWEFSPPPLIL
jgi:hypothetical protein